MNRNLTLNIQNSREEQIFIKRKTSRELAKNHDVMDLEYFQAW